MGTLKSFGVIVCPFVGLTRLLGARYTGSIENQQVLPFFWVKRAWRRPEREQTSSKQIYIGVAYGRDRWNW